MFALVEKLYIPLNSFSFHRSDGLKTNHVKVLDCLGWFLLSHLNRSLIYKNYLLYFSFKLKKI